MNIITDLQQTEDQTYVIRGNSVMSHGMPHDHNQMEIYRTTPQVQQQLHNNQRNIITIESLAKDNSRHSLYKSDSQKSLNHKYADSFKSKTKSNNQIESSRLKQHPRAHPNNNNRLESVSFNGRSGSYQRSNVADRRQSNLTDNNSNEFDRFQA